MQRMDSVAYHHCVELFISLNNGGESPNYFAVRSVLVVIHCLQGGSAQRHQVGSDFIFILSYLALLWNWKKKACYSELGLILLLRAQKSFQYLQPCKSRRLKKISINHMYKEESITPALKGAGAWLSAGLWFVQLL